MVERELAFAQPVEHVFHHVGEGHHVIEREQSGRALDGVHAAEQRVELLRILCARLDLQQVALHFLQHFAAFGEKGLEHLIQVHSGAPSSTAIDAGSPSSAARFSSIRASSTGAL